MLVYRKREAERSYFARPEDMPRLLHALLVQRGVSSADEARAFLSPGEEILRDPLLLSDMEKAASRLRAALAKGERVCVYGDYDVDGVTAAAILSLHLKSLGADVRTYLPDRHREGYGLNEQAVRALAEDLQDKLEAQEIYPRRKEGFRESRWIVLDYSSVIVHIFHPEEREYYNIERLWTDGSNRIALHFQDE